MRIGHELRVGSSGDGPYGLAVATDRALWATFPFSGRVARVVSGRVEQHTVGTPASRVSLAVADGDGIWVTRTGDDRLSHVAPDGKCRDVDLPPGSQPYGIARSGGDLLVSGLGGQLWRVRGGRIVDRAELPDGAFPGMVAVAADGAVWCTLNQADALARWDGDLSLVPTGAGSAPVGICADTSSGGVWWTEIGAGRVGYRGPGGDRYRVDLPGARPRPHAVVSDGAGGVFVTAWGSGALLHVGADRSVDELALGAGSEPHGVAVDDDATVWVALESGSLAAVVGT